MNVRLLLPAFVIGIVFFLESASFLAAQDVVISKIFNGGTGRADSVELLVIRRNLDMRGMILRDFTPEADGPGGGYRFRQHPIWSSVSSGTVIVLASRSSSALTQSSFTLTVGLMDTTYFEPISTTSTFDIAAQDMVMLKSSTASFAGFEGNIHTMGVGINSSRAFTISPAFFTFTNSSLNTETPYALAVLTTSFVFTGNGPDFVRITSDTSYGGAAYTPVRFGAAHSADHQRLLNQLRGISTSVQETPPSGFSSIFPNPATERIGVRFSQIFTKRFANAETLTISCYTMLGTCIDTRRVAIDNAQTEYWYSCADLPPGAYILEFRVDNGFVERQKFVKVR